ncbi:MAG: diguanylate cyclase [Gemmatimonadetes bacterium]|nr:diguanylate cyclase [Gemmatimonadota bacterium]
MSLLSKLEARSAPFWIVAGCAGVVLVGIADVETGREVAFSLFYLIPIVAVTWFAGRRPGLFVSIVAAATWYLAEWLDGQPYTQPAIRYWNAGVRLVFFVVITVLLPALKALEAEKENARVDPLTGAANRRRFFEALQGERDRTQRYHRAFTLAYFDLDGFKVINDRFGHLTGDRLLCAVVAQAQSALRKTDLLARLGGDEFIVLLPETNAESARTIVPKLQAALVTEMQRHAWAVTFSIGTITCLDGLADADELLRRADELMYAMKRQGGNSIGYATVGV